MMTMSSTPIRLSTAGTIRREEAALLHRAVKALLPRLESELLIAQSRLSSLSPVRLSSLEDMTQEEVLDAVEPYMDAVSSEYRELYGYMRDNGLYDLDILASSSTLGVTVSLPAYRSAYILSSAQGSYLDVKTLIHEFGHFANHCLAEDEQFCYDVAETHSQGLEALYLTFADSLAGQAGGDAYRAAILSDLLGMLYFCMYDEFEQAVYQADGLTVSGMNRLYRSISESYGFLYSIGGEEAYDWAANSQLFEQPCYTISYVTSVLNSLELLVDSAEDFDAAADTYLALVAQTDTAGYRDAVARGSHRHAPARCRSGCPGGGGAVFLSGDLRSVLSRPDGPLVCPLRPDLRLLRPLFRG